MPPRALAAVVVSLLMPFAVLAVTLDRSHDATAGAQQAALRLAPDPNARIPTGPKALAGLMTGADVALRRAIETWRTQGDPATGAPPDDVVFEALFLQRALRRLSRHPAIAARTRVHLPPRLARTTRDVVTSLRELRRLAAEYRPRPDRVRTGPPQPIGVLLGHYRAAQMRFKVGAHVLAAVNFVESAFGRLRNNSSAGAQGPMQFIPSTWNAYGMGGDVRDPRDAIMGAANYLRASGAPNYARALYAYNPSRLYVRAVRRYARLINRDRAALYMLYSWQVFVRLPGGGERRVTGPGLAE
ncbi:MAG: lytic murein transglycosylase [Solirubrobacteraceae bacterium]